METTDFLDRGDHVTARTMFGPVRGTVTDFADDPLPWVHVRTADGEGFLMAASHVDLLDDK